MTATPVGTIDLANETRVCPSSTTALEVLGVKDEGKIKKEAAADAARVLRGTFRLRAPVDPVAVAQELGIQVLEGEFDRDRLGGLVMEPGEEPKIYMNQLDLLIRRRLTCAMELGHYIRRSAETDKYSRVDRRSDPRDPDPRSVYAAEFATCLLMPSLDVKVMIELGIDDLEMALRFRVPRELVRLRLSELGLQTRDLLEA